MKIKFSKLSSKLFRSIALLELKFAAWTQVRKWAMYLNNFGQKLFNNVFCKN